MKTIKTDLHPNCTKFEVDLKSKVLIQYFEPEKAEFKRGDYVASDDTICIFKEYSSSGGFTSIENNVGDDNYCWCERPFNLASKKADHRNGQLPTRKRLHLQQDHARVRKSAPIQTR